METGPMSANVGGGVDTKVPVMEVHDGIEQQSSVDYRGNASSTQSEALGSSGIPLDTVVEVQVLEFRGLSSSWLASVRKYEPASELQLVASWMAFAASNSKRKSTSETKFKISSELTRQSAWSFPDAAVVQLRVHPLTSNHANPLVMELVMAPADRSQLWKLSIAFSVRRLLNMVRNTESCIVEARVCDQDDQAVGTSRLRLRWGPMDSLVSPVPGDPIILTKQLGNLSVQILSVDGLSAPTSDGASIVWRIRSLGQNMKSAFLSPPIQLKGDISMIETSVDVEDMLTDAIVIELVRCHPRERSTVIAWTSVPVGQGEDVRAPLLTTEADVCGHIQLALKTRPVVDDENSVGHSLAASILGENAYATLKVGDVRGDMEIEFIRVSILPLDTTSTQDVSIRMQLVPGTWSASSPLLRVSSSGFAEWPESHRRTIQWSSKERIVPSLRCEVNLQLQIMPEKSPALVKQLPSSKINSTIPPLDYSGVVSVDLPAFFAHPGVWSTLEVTVPLRSTDRDLQSTPVPSAPVQIKLRFVDGTEEENEEAVLNGEAQSERRGRLSIALLCASGPFLMRNNSPSSTEYYVSLQCGEGQTAQTRIVKVSEEGELVWKDPLVGLISKLPAPLVFLSLHRRSQDQKNDPDVIVGVVALPVFPTILSDNHLVGFALPLVASEKGNGGGARKRQGILSFEMQFIASAASATTSVSSLSETRLVLHQLIGWREGGLIPPLIRNIRLQVLLVGATVSETLWTHESEVLVVQTQSPALSLDRVVSLDEAIRKTRVNLSKRLDLVVRVCDVDRNRLGQTIIPVRGSWEKLMEREQEALHKIYRSSTSGDPEAVAHIQVTIEKVNSTSTSDVKDVGDPVDGWLYVEILEAFNALVTSQKEEAAVQIALQREVHVEKALRPKPWKSRKQWSTRSGEWSWVDEFASFPYHREKPCTLNFSILLSTNGVRASTCALDIEAIVQGASESPYEEWVAIDTSQLQVRFTYLPANAGCLSVKINCMTAVRASKLPYPVDRVALKCTDGSNSTSSKPQDVALADATDMSVLQTLVSVTVRLSLDFARSRPRSPYLTIETVGMSSTLGETRIGRGCVPLVPLLSTQTDQWLSLLAPNDLTIRISAMHCSFQFRQATVPSTSGSLAAISPEIASHDEWHRLSAAVMAIWKKLFYHLDADRNGKVDLDEFKSLFRDHFKLFSSTSDGQTLLRLLTTQSKSDISESTVEHLFHEMDINDNEEIDWNEYVMFLQAKLHAVVPVEASVTPVTEPLTEDSTQNSSKQTELRRKRREDRLSPCTANGSQRKTESVRAPRLARPDRLLGMRSSSRVNGSASRVTSNERCLSRVEVSETPELELLREENAQVRAQLRAVEAQLALEQQRSRRQHETIQALQRQLTQFQLQQHKARVEEQTRAQRIQETIQRHEQELLVREATRKKHQAASIVLQSRVRTRLETKRYQALRMTRWNATVRIQCWFRMIQAQKWLKVQRELARIKRLRHTSATRLQWFTRYHLCRKERQLLIGARNLAATIIQKYTRRLQALRERHSRMRATLSVQSRVKLWLAQREAERLHRARDVLRHRLRGWALRRRWNHVQCSIRKMQRWWRVACDQRWEYIARLEAAVCIQATWRGILHRRRWARGNYEAQATLTENQISEDVDAIPLTDVVESNSFALEFTREDLKMASNGGEIESFLVLADEKFSLDEDVQGDFTEYMMEGGDHGEASSPDLPHENTESFLVIVEGAGHEESVRRMSADNGDQDRTSSAVVELIDEHVSACLYELIDAIDQVASSAAWLPVDDTRSDGTDAPRSLHTEERTTSDPDESPNSPTSTPESDFIGGEMSNSTKIQDTPECEVILTMDDAGDTCVPPVDDVIVGDEDERECEVQEIAQDALGKAKDDDELPHDQVQGTYSDAGNPDGTMDKGLSELDNDQHQLKENDLGGTPAAELQDSNTEGAPDSSFADSAYESSESVSPVLYEPDVSTPLVEEDPNDVGEEAEYQTNADVTSITHPDPIEIESEPNLDHAETTNEGGTFVDELMTNEAHVGASDGLTGEHESGTFQATGEEPAKVDCEEQDVPSFEDGGADRGVTAEDKHLQEAPTSLLEDQFEDESNPKGMTVPNVSSLSGSPADTTKHSEVQDEDIAMAITDEESSKNELDTNFTVDTVHSDDLTQTALSELGPSVIQEPSGEVLEEAMQSEDSKDMTDIVEISTAIESFESPRDGDSKSEADRNADSVDSDALMLEAGEVAVFDPREVVSNGPPQAGEAEVEVPIPQEPDNKVDLTRQDSDAFLADFAAFGPTSTEAMASGSETPVLMMADLD